LKRTPGFYHQDPPSVPSSSGKSLNGRHLRVAGCRSNGHSTATSPLGPDLSPLVIGEVAQPPASAPTRSPTTPSLQFPHHRGRRSTHLRDDSS
jgi:hypothetical protein